MPTRHNRKLSKRSGGRGRGGGGDVVRFRSTFTLSSSFTSGKFTQSLIPSNSTNPSAQQVSDVYEFYRISKLRYRMHPPTTTPTSHQAAVYVAGVVDTPSAFDNATIALAPHHVILTARQTVPSPWVKVSKAALASYAVWYKTLAGTPDTADEVQGLIYIAGTGTDQFLLEVDITYLFKGLVGTGATPEMRIAAQMFREQQRLLRILSFGRSTQGELKSDTPVSKAPGQAGVPVGY